MLENVIVALAYFYFHYRYFALASATVQRPQLSGLLLVVTFLLNYALFFACSILELNLIFNWALFFLFLLGETVVYCKSDWRASLFLSLSGILYGLSVNIFCRCVVAIVAKQPLVAFDNNISSAGNLKFIPVFLGFALGGILLHLMARPRAIRYLRTLIDHPEHLAFQLELMVGMFLYLFLNLLLYQCQWDGVLLKLWGIKSCVFSLVGFYLGLRYSLKMCRLSDYREENRTIQRELAQSEQQQARLRTIAYRDALTGAYNRQYALQRLDALLAQQARFILCFLDLDDLKGVNDRFGHAEGDRYLNAVARELTPICRRENDLLSRFGGDEFLLLLSETTAGETEQRLAQADRNLQALSQSEMFAFPMSISFGVVDRAPEDAADTLFSRADQAMYCRKRARHGRMLHTNQDLDP